MNESTFENHYKFGYNGIFFNDRASVDDQWFFSLGTCARHEAFMVEAVRAARLLRSRNPDVPLTICMSGGVDSELCAHVFLAAGIDFSCVIANWDNANIHDTGAAVNYCDSNRIPYRIISCNLVDFFLGPLATHYADITGSDNPYLLPHMWLMDQVAFPILGNGEPDIYCNALNSWVCSFKEQVAAWHKFIIRSGKRGCGGFWEYTPGLMLAYLDAILDRPEIQNRKISNFKKLKARLIHDLAGLRIRPKYTGFEVFQEQHRELVIQFGSQLRQRYPRPEDPLDTRGPFMLKNSIEIDVYVLREMLTARQPCEGWCNE